MGDKERIAPTPPPAPRTQEAHPAGYDYRARFSRLNPIHGSEGGTVYVADPPDEYYVVTDESTLADLLGEDGDWVHVYGFDTRAQRDAFCEARYGRLPGYARAGHDPEDSPAGDPRKDLDEARDGDGGGERRMPE